MTPLFFATLPLHVVNFYSNNKKLEDLRVRSHGSLESIQGFEGLKGDLGLGLAYMPGSISEISKFLLGCSAAVVL